MRRRKPAKNDRAPPGTNPFTVVSTCERRTCEASVTNGEDATAVPTSQAMSSRLTTLTAEPAKASTSRAGRQVNRLRTAAPSRAART